MRDNEFIGTSFHLRAALKCSMSNVCKELNMHKSLKLIGDLKGKTRYQIIKAFEDTESSTLELSGHEIVLTFLSRRPDRTSYNRNFLILVSLITSLKEFYSIEFEDLYSYIIEAVRNNWQNTVKDHNLIIESLKERVGLLSDSNCKLSRQLITLSGRNMVMVADLSVYREFSKRVIEISKERAGSSKISILSEIGIDKADVDNVEMRLKSERGG